MILIAGHQVSTCQDALEKHPNELDTIVFLDPGSQMPPFISKLAKNYISFEFYDSTDIRPSTLPPQKHHIEEILKWSEDKDNLLVVCHMGISRSSAVALLIAVTKLGLDKAFEVLSPGHLPNRLILKIGSEILGLPVYEEYLKWHSKTYELTGPN